MTLLTLGVAKLDPIHVNGAETVSRDARRPKIEILVQIMVENRVQIDKLSIER